MQYRASCALGRLGRIEPREPGGETNLEIFTKTPAETLGRQVGRAGFPTISLRFVEVPEVQVTNRATVTVRLEGYGFQQKPFRLRGVTGFLVHHTHPLRVAS
jgi:hypothetical protein